MMHSLNGSTKDCIKKITYLLSDLSLEYIASLQRALGLNGRLPPKPARYALPRKANAWIRIGSLRFATAPHFFLLRFAPQFFARYL